MSAKRTPWWQPALALALGTVAGAVVAELGERFNLTLIGAPWFVAALLIAIGIIVLILALNVHKYATTDPRKRPSTFINPRLAFDTLVLSKALALAGAMLAGWYGGQIIPTIGHIEADFYSQAVIECAVTAVVCLIDMIIGLVGEWLCQLPPTEGPENPKMKRAERERGVAPAAAKTVR
ncbi:DUF3180 domain-containing protein [Bifidobacterium callitrichos]|uniref:DUF3180 domain-containing protein n=2 Tax=Bifidobacterium callitrichos TaxID=762209 RepID=A0A5M9ZFH6_9BIFI|nr:DUF3180 domain-containing protein [Bifidobacterium callitrichos]KAA8817715.1 DUF3180 domain-containing protein [Bifidobacterium callitrichos]KFI56143.1 membrane protein [Bifidobacterium callitrichos DSM 23973]